MLHGLWMNANTQKLTKYTHVRNIINSIEFLYHRNKKFANAMMWLNNSKASWQWITITGTVPDIYPCADAECKSLHYVSLPIQHQFKTKIIILSRASTVNASTCVFSIDHSIGIKTQKSMT